LGGKQVYISAAKKIYIPFADVLYLMMAHIQGMHKNEPMPFFIARY
jgi:hypothetical protein